MRMKLLTTIILIFSLSLISACGIKPVNDDTSLPDTEDPALTGNGDSARSEDDDHVLPGNDGILQPGADETDQSGQDGTTPDSDDNTKNIGAATGEASSVDRIKSTLQKNDLPVVNDELIEVFFDYYNESHGQAGPYHQYELRLLPEFGAGKAPDWEGLTVFAFYMANQFERDTEGYSFFTKDAFDSTVDRMFSDLQYTHQSSGFFEYADEKYTAKGWDFHGSVYYRLNEISRSDDGIYTAAFEGFSFDELDSFEEKYEWVSDNMKAVFDYADDGAAEVTREDIVLEIFQQDDYKDILHVSEQVEITFSLSSDTEFAFKYLSCDRMYIE